MCEHCDTLAGRLPLTRRGVPKPAAAATASLTLVPDALAANAKAKIRIVGGIYTLTSGPGRAVALSNALRSRPARSRKKPPENGRLFVTDSGNAIPWLS